MKLLAIVSGMVIVLMVGFWLMYTGFRGMIASPSSLGLEILGFFGWAGVLDRRSHRGGTFPETRV